MKNENDSAIRPFVSSTTLWNLKIIQTNIAIYTRQLELVKPEINYNHLSVSSQTESSFTPDTNFLAEERTRKVHDRIGYTHCRSSIDVPRLSGNTGMV